MIGRKFLLGHKKQFLIEVLVILLIPILVLNISWYDQQVFNHHMELSISENRYDIKYIGNVVEGKNNLFNAELKTLELKLPKKIDSTMVAIRASQGLSIIGKNNSLTTLIHGSNVLFQALGLEVGRYSNVQIGTNKSITATGISSSNTTRFANITLYENISPKSLLTLADTLFLSSLFGDVQIDNIVILLPLEDAFDRYVTLPLDNASTLIPQIDLSLSLRANISREILDRDSFSKNFNTVNQISTKISKLISSLGGNSVTSIIGEKIEAHYKAYSLFEDKVLFYFQLPLIAMVIAVLYLTLSTTIGQKKLAWKKIIDRGAPKEVLTDLVIALEVIKYGITIILVIPIIGIVTPQILDYINVFQILTKILTSMLIITVVEGVILLVELFNVKKLFEPDTHTIRDDRRSFLLSSTRVILNALYLVAFFLILRYLITVIRPARVSFDYYSYVAGMIIVTVVAVSTTSLLAYKLVSAALQKSVYTGVFLKFAKSQFPVYGRNLIFYLLTSVLLLYLIGSITFASTVRVSYADSNLLGEYMIESSEELRVDDIVVIEYIRIKLNITVKTIDGERSEVAIFSISPDDLSRLIATIWQDMGVIITNQSDILASSYREIPSVIRSEIASNSSCGSCGTEIDFLSNYDNWLLIVRDADFISERSFYIFPSISKEQKERIESIIDVNGLSEDTLFPEEFVPFGDPETYISLLSITLTIAIALNTISAINLLSILLDSVNEDYRLMVQRGADRTVSRIGLSTILTFLLIIPYILYLQFFGVIHTIDNMLFDTGITEAMNSVNQTLFFPVWISSLWVLTLGMVMIQTRKTGDR